MHHASRRFFFELFAAAGGPFPWAGQAEENEATKQKKIQEIKSHQEGRTEGTNGHRR